MVLHFMAVGSYTLCPMLYINTTWSDDTCQLISICNPTSPVGPEFWKRIISHFRTWFSEFRATHKQIEQYLLKEAAIYEWRKVRRTDSKAGDTMEAASLAGKHADWRSNSYIRVRPKSHTYFLISCFLQYEMLEFTKGSGYRSKTFYGRLEHIYTVTFAEGCQGLQILHPTTYIIACIHRCRIRRDDPQLSRLDIHLYKDGDETHINVTDITSVQCLVGRVRDGSDGWAIIDRSGTLARAVYLGEESGSDG